MRTTLLLIIIFASSNWKVETLTINKNDVDIALTETLNEKTGAIASCVQGKLEIVLLKQKDNTSIKVSAFPNPLKHNISILTLGKADHNLKYKLTINDKVLTKGSLKKPKDSININQYDGDTFILDIMYSDEQLKRYKIVKH